VVSVCTHKLRSRPCLQHQYSAAVAFPPPLFLLLPQCLDWTPVSTGQRRVIVEAAERLHVEHEVVGLQHLRHGLEAWDGYVLGGREHLALARCLHRLFPPRGSGQPACMVDGEFVWIADVSLRRVLIVGCIGAYACIIFGQRGLRIVVLLYKKINLGRT